MDDMDEMDELYTGIDIYNIFNLLNVILYYAGTWALFVKMGRKGWLSLIPFKMHMCSER